MLVEFLADYALFFAKVATFVVAIIIIIGAAISAGQRPEAEPEGKLEIKKLNERYDQMEDAIRTAVLEGKDLKQYHKQKKRESKAVKKDHKKDSAVGAKQKQVFVLDFDGDMKASAVRHFREEVTAVLTMAGKDDEVVVRLESPGGMVHSYGLAASQLVRLKTAGVPLTICVDKVAASGGYMMACIADKLLAAPFAVIGSIGVVASIPNFNRVLKKHDVDYELLTAGEYKRTLTMFGENTEAGRRKFIDDLEDTHELFKGFVGEYRPQLDITEVATGETWYGERAINKKLVDAISTSDEYITGLAKQSPVYQVHYIEKKHWQEKLGLSVENALENTLYRLAGKARNLWESKH